MAWAWLSPPVVDFGAPSTRRGVRTVWLHADPHRALGLPPSADPVELRRAHRRLARLHHPDAGAGEATGLDRFHEIQGAFDAIVGAPELQVRPLDGEWWQVAGFVRPDPVLRAASVVTGIRFEAHHLERLRWRDAGDEARITYAGQTLSLPVVYTGARSALPVWRARMAAVAEPVALLIFCLSIVPMLAAFVALDVLFVSGGDRLATWLLAILVLCLGYGALAAALGGLGLRLPRLRSALRRTRAIARPAPGDSR